MKEAEDFISYSDHGVGMVLPNRIKKLSKETLKRLG